MRSPAFLLLVLLGVFLTPVAASAQTSPLAQRLVGRIVLQVQAHGEAWYIDPIEKQRYFLGTADDAYALMRAKGLGIRHVELSRYLASRFPARLSGRILLDVERRGEAYYVDPLTLRGSFLGKASDAYALMRAKGLGITNTDLAQIPAISPRPVTPAAPAPAPTSAVSALEREAFGLINAHRRSIGISELIWNDAIATIARGHSQNMADGKTAFGHDGFNQRLNALQATMTVRGIAENVAMNDYPSPAPIAVGGWIQSPGHKINLETPTYTQSAIGVATSEDGSSYFTQIFVK